MKKIIVNLTTEQLEKIKKIYEVSKKQSNLDISIDEFIEKMIITSLNTHLQLNEMNESMSKMLKNITDTMGSDFKVDDALKDLDSMVQEIFKNNVENNNQDNLKKNNNSNNDKKIKN